MHSDYDYSHISNYEELKKLQNVLLEIMKVVDAFCERNRIPYSISGGNMLGAVRHGGFIPWDDDFDICMKREDYDRFIRLWLKNPPEGYILQNKELNAPDIEISFSKIRKDHTTFLQYERDRGKHHVGIFIDIFPIDRIPDGKLRRYLFYWRCMKYQLYNREFVPPKSGAAVRLGSKVLLLLSSKKSRKKKRAALLKKITRYNSDTTCRLVGNETMNTIKKEFSPDLLNSFTTVSFEGVPLKCFRNWKEYLETFYGDYMKLPPKEQQDWYHHPIILDFEHNYEELMNQ